VSVAAGEPFAETVHARRAFGLQRCADLSGGNPGQLAQRSADLIVVNLTEVTGAVSGHGDQGGQRNDQVAGIELPD
jgi:hypothetical protein